MSKENKTSYIILGLLQHENLSGYDIKKKIDLMISHFWEAGYGQIYPTLKQLVENCEIQKEEVETHKGPERIIYSITDKGKNKLKEWLKIPDVNVTVKYEILLKLFFGNVISIDENIERIQRFEKVQKENLDMIVQFKQNLSTILTADDDKDHLYYFLTVLFGEKIYQAYLDWSKEAISYLREN